MIKKIFRFLLRLLTLFIWKGKKPCDRPCCSKGIELPESLFRKKYVKMSKEPLVVGFRTKKGKMVKVKATKGKKNAKKKNIKKKKPKNTKRKKYAI